MSELLGVPAVGNAPDLVARLLTLYPASPDATEQPWRRHALLVVSAPVASPAANARRAARQHVADRLSTLFPECGAIHDVGNDRMAILLLAHAGLSRSTEPLAQLIEGGGVDDVSVWWEHLPPDPELLGAFVRGVRTKVPSPPIPAGVDPRSMADVIALSPVRVKRPQLPRAGSLVSIAAAVAVLLAMTGIALRSPDPSGENGTEVAASSEPPATADPAATQLLEDLGYEVVEESSSADGVAMLVLEPPTETATDSPSGNVGVGGSEGGDAVAVSGPGPDGADTDLPDVVLAAVGATPEDAVALLDDQGQPVLMFVGVPAVEALPTDLPLIIALRGSAPPELCALLTAVPTATVVGDAPDCAELIAPTVGNPLP